MIIKKKIKKTISRTVSTTLVLALAFLILLSNLSVIFANHTGNIVHELAPSNLPNQVQSDNTGMLWFDYASNG